MRGPASHLLGLLLPLLLGGLELLVEAVETVLRDGARLWTRQNQTPAGYNVGLNEGAAQVIVTEGVPRRRPCVPVRAAR